LIHLFKIPGVLAPTEVGGTGSGITIKSLLPWNHVVPMELEMFLLNTEYPPKNEAISHLGKKNHLQIYLGWGYASFQEGTLSPIIMVQRKSSYI